MHNGGCVTFYARVFSCALTMLRSLRKGTFFLHVRASLCLDFMQWSKLAKTGAVLQFQMVFKKSMTLISAYFCRPSRAKWTAKPSEDEGERGGSTTSQRGHLADSRRRENGRGEEGRRRAGDGLRLVNWTELNWWTEEKAWLQLSIRRCSSSSIPPW